MLVNTVKKAEYKDVAAVYKLYFKNDNRFYIGSTNNLQERLQAHCRAIAKQKHFNIYFQRLCIKRGLDNLEFEILAKSPEEYLIKMEQWFINNLKPELNLAEIAGRPPKNRKKGYKTTEETKLKISKSKVGKTVDRNGYKHSKETLEKMSKSLKGRVFSEEWRENMRNAKQNGGKYSKLNIEQVKEIKKLVGTKFDKDIALLFNCSRATINQIKNNKIWKEV